MPNGLSQFGDEHYGVDVYETMNDLVKDPFVMDKLSLPTTVNVGSYLVTAYEIASSAGPGMDITQILNLALDIAMDIAAEIAGEVISEVFALLSDLLPMLLSYLDALVGIVDGVRAAEEAQRAQAAIEWMQACFDISKKYQIKPTGPDGTSKPSDFFVQAYRAGIGVGGEEKFVDTGRVPFIGRMLQLITEQQWSGYWLTIQNNPAGLFGVSQEAYDNLNAMQHDARDWCAPGIWPPIQQYAPNFKRLRRAITKQSIALRQMQGKSPGDSGSALWPIYMDLLFAAVQIDQWPLAPFYGEAAPGFVPKPPLNEPMLRALYSSGAQPLGFPTTVGYVAKMEALMDDLEVGCNPGQSFPYWTPLKLFGEYKTFKGGKEWRPGCYGDPTSGLNAILGMVAAWGNTVRPIYADDIAAQERALEGAISKASISARQRIRELDLDVPREGVTSQTQALDSIRRLNRMGMLGEDETAEGFEAINGGAKPSAWPVVVAGAALGFFLVKRRG